jgi:hypothetical protein
MGISGSLEEILHVVLCNFLLSLPSLGIPYPVEFSHISGVTLLRVRRSVVYGSEVRGRSGRSWCTSIKR